MRGLADPAAGIAIDPELSSIIANNGLTLDTIKTHEEKVRAEVARWLGPAFGKWDESQITEWAGRMRNDPDAMEELTAMLRTQRMSLFPEYTNENLTYEDIAGPWRNLFNQVWQIPADEMDPFFTQVLRMNNYHEASKALISEGLTRNVGAVKQGLETASLNVGGQLRPMTMGG
jgi:hypothetical protein